MKLLLPFHLQKVGAGFPSPATDYIEDDIQSIESVEEGL